MMKLFVPFVFAGTILVQVCATEPLPPSDHESHKIGEDDEQNPYLGCILFGEPACHIDCFLSIDVYYYNIKTAGICDEKQSCHCHYKVDKSLSNNWSMKFDLDYVYRAMSQDDAIFDQVYNLFQYPLRTADQFKKLLKPELSPYQYFRLKTSDESLASTFINDKGEIDEKLVRQYVTDKLQPVFDSNGKYYFYTDYKQNLRDALKNVRDEGTVYNFSYGIRRLKIKTLEDIWQEHLTANKLQEPDIEFDNDKNLDFVLHQAVINEIIKQRDEMNVDPKVAQAIYEALNSHNKLPPTTKKLLKAPSLHQ